MAALHHTEEGEGGGSIPLAALGDSITWGFPGGPVTSWVRRVADASGLEILNLGVNGDTLADLRERVHQVLELGPRACIVMGGTNDVALGRPLEDMCADLAATVEAMRDGGVSPLVGSPPPHGDPHCERQLDGLRHFINAMAGTRGVRVIHFDRAFRDDAGEVLGHLFCDDSHPSLEGYEAMARHLIDSGALAEFGGSHG